MSFSQAFADMFCSRFEDKKELEPLTSCEEYKRRREALEAALKDAGDTGDIWQAVLELGDIVSQFYYRAGVRDGASINTDNFLVPA